MAKKILSIIILLLIILLTGAFVYLKLGFMGSDSDVVNSNFRTRLASYPWLRNLFALKYDGDAKADYLSANYKNILVEVDSMEGVIVSSDVLSGLAERIQNSTGKPTSYILSTKY